MPRGSFRIETLRHCGIAASRHRDIGRTTKAGWVSGIKRNDSIDATGIVLVHPDKGDLGIGAA